MSKTIETKNHYLSFHQIAAIRKHEELAEIIDTKKTIDLFMQQEAPLSYQQIAMEVLPEELYALSEDVARAAVGKIIKDNVSKEQLDLLSKNRQIAFGRRNLMGNMTTEEFTQKQSSLAKIRHNKEIPINTSGIVEGRGMIRWTKEEKALVKILAANPDFLHQKGSQKGKPNAKLISEFINNLAHQGNSVRTKYSIHEILRPEKE